MPAESPLTATECRELMERMGQFSAQDKRALLLTLRKSILHRCESDGLFWLEFVKTRDEADPKAPVKPFPVHLQYVRDLWGVLAEHRRIVIAKSRQMILSWVLCAFCTHTARTRPHSHIVWQALANGTPVLTPSGWTKVEDLRPGDHVVAGTGQITRVEGVYPQALQALWRVRFSDGAEVDVTENHLWAVYWHRNQETRIWTTGQIRDALGRSRHMKVHVPWAGPAEFPERPVPIAPYLLGVLLGDGAFSGNGVAVSSRDAEILDKLRAELPHKHRLVHHENHDWTISGTGARGGNQVTRALREMSLLGKKAEQKFIPSVYLWNAPAIRLAVLQGLMDADGHATRGRSAVFYTTSPFLAEDVVWLVRSLGGCASWRDGGYPPSNFVRRSRIYRVGIILPAGQNPFQCSRKAVRYAQRRHRRKWRRVVEVSPIGDGASTCIRVAHPSALYVIKDFVVTHNTQKKEDGCMMVSMAGADKDSGYQGRIQFIEAHLPPWLQVPIRASEGMIQYPNGSLIEALAGGANQIRSKVPSLIIQDEFAFQDEARGVYGAVAPLIQKATKFIAVSTPNGMDNIFAELYHGYRVTGEVA